MQPFPTTVCLVLAAVLAAVFAGTPGHAQEHAGHHPPAAADTHADSARRFAADATLAENMRGIRVAVEALDHYQHGHMGPEQAVILATKIRGHANEIIAKCKLPADADAALHAILVPLMSGAAALEREPTRTGVIAPMQEALAQYERRFSEDAAQVGAPPQP